MEGIVEIVPCFEDHFMVVLAFGDGEEGVFDQEVEESFEARLEFLENVIEFDGVHEVVDFFIILLPYFDDPLIVCSYFVPQFPFHPIFVLPIFFDLL